MIHILWCTVRPKAFKVMHEQWIKRSSNRENILTHVAVNNDIDLVYISDNCTTHRIINLMTDKKGVCLPSYRLSSTLEYEEDDIIVFASDDFIPPNNWDTYLINKLSGRKDALFVRDGYQLPDSSNMLHPAITIPIMKGHTLKMLNGAIYHPEYTHMFSDCELYLNLRELNLLFDDRISDETTFEHLHHASGKRVADDNDRQYYSNWRLDEETWNKRKKMTLEERLFVNENY